LFIPKNEGGWSCVAETNFGSVEKQNEIIPEIQDYRRLHTVKPEDHESLQDFDIIIPVNHKEHAIAYSLIGGIKDKDDLYNKIEFITTITNIIAVAIENKRLFKKQIAQERMRKEIELASEVQHNLIPEILPSTDRYELASIYKPHFNVGGDYFDYLSFSKDKFAFCIADISGKGVAAALLMANFQALLQSLIYQYRDMETFIFALNQSVYRITKGEKFITFFIAEVDLSKNTMTYINAGHYPPLLKNNEGLRKLDKGCTVIGAFDKLPEIKEEKLDLGTEAMILTFTDGLAELRAEDGTFFEDDKIANFIEEHYTLTAKDFNNQLLKMMDNFKGDVEYSDDIAVLTCKIHDINSEID